MKEKAESHNLGCTTILLLLVTMVLNIVSITLGVLNSVDNGDFDYY